MDIYTKKDITKLFKISTSTLNRWMEDGRINYVKVQKRVFFLKEDVENLIKSNYIKN